MHNELIVVESEKESRSNKQDTFVIEQELASISVEEFESTYGTFAGKEFVNTMSFPIYQVLWQRFVAPRTEHRTRLMHLVLLYDRFESCIDENNIDSIKCINIDKKYQAFVIDVAEANNIETNVAHTVSRPARITSFLIALLGVSVFFMDQLFSLVAGFFFQSPDKLSTVVVPSMGRLHSIEPVLDAAEFDFDLIVPPMTIAWLRSSSEFSDISSYDPVPINTLVTVGTIAQEVLFLTGDIRSQLLGRVFDEKMSEFLSEEFGAEMRHSIAYEIDELLTSSLLRSFLYYVLFENIVSRKDCEKIVVNSASPLGNSIMAAGKNHSIDLYHVRHGVVTGYTPSTPFESTEFVEGPLATKQLNSVDYVTDTSNFIETGYPYLKDIYNTDAGDFLPDEPLTIFIGTQPVGNSIRTEFIKDAIEGINKLPMESEITIKTHPEESAEWYDSVVDDSDITVAEDALHKYINNSDIAIIMSSNVGLEAMLMNTPCVCINKWRPLLRAQPYTIHCPVPLLESKTEVLSFFNSLDREKLQKIHKQQQESLPDDFILHGNPAEDMADYIER